MLDFFFLMPPEVRGGHGVSLPRGREGSEVGCKVRGELLCCFSFPKSTSPGSSGRWAGVLQRALPVLVAHEDTEGLRVPLSPEISLKYIPWYKRFYEAEGLHVSRLVVSLGLMRSNIFSQNYCACFLLFKKKILISEKNASPVRF